MVQRRDVVLAKVWFSDGTGSKTRPCIVLSDEKYNQDGFVLATPITTAGDEYCLVLDEADLNCPFYPGSGVRFDGVLKFRSDEIAEKLGKTSLPVHSKLVERIVAMIR